jgi:hypothetical protein
MLVNVRLVYNQGGGTHNTAADRSRQIGREYCFISTSSKKKDVRKVSIVAFKAWASPREVVKVLLNVSFICGTQLQNLATTLAYYYCTGAASLSSSNFRTSSPASLACSRGPREVALSPPSLPPYRACQLLLIEFEFLGIELPFGTYFSADTSRGNF